ncbi:LCP family protein [Pseudonocardia phyllosphaerae]|uniref:LCP family protein n=1 Tax=Pseudonocardia phyllosphaerae TaxID=3390502 RepID=UPI00397CF1C6
MARPAPPQGTNSGGVARPAPPQGTDSGGVARPASAAHRSAADSRVTEVFDAIVPRRLRRRYADELNGATPDTQDEPEPEAGSAADTEAPVPEPGKPETGEPETEPDNPIRRRLRVGAGILALVVLAVTAWGFVGRSRIDDAVRTVPALAPTSDAILDAAAQAGDRNVLVLGLAADRANNVPDAARTDTAVLVHQPADGQAVALTIPGTLEVARPPCRRFDPAPAAYGDTVPAESRVALATTYDVGGPECAVGAVQQLTGIPVTGFVAFDVAGADGLVHSVDGVDVCAAAPVDDPAHGASVPAGRTELDGAGARGFASAVTPADAASPADRIARQQQVLAGALGSALSTSSLLTPGAPGQAAQGVAGSLVADGVSAGEILSLARQLAGTDGPGDLIFSQAPVSPAPNTRGHLDLQRSDARKLFAALREHTPLPEGSVAPAPPAACG